MISFLNPTKNILIHSEKLYELFNCLNDSKSPRKSNFSKKLLLKFAREIFQLTPNSPGGNFQIPGKDNIKLSKKCSQTFPSEILHVLKQEHFNFFKFSIKSSQKFSGGILYFFFRISLNTILCYAIYSSE